MSHFLESRKADVRFDEEKVGGGSPVVSETSHLDDNTLAGALLFLGENLMWVDAERKRRGGGILIPPGKRRKRHIRDTDRESRSDSYGKLPSYWAN